MTVADPDGTGTPISAWAGRGSSGGQGTGGNTGASATGDRGGCCGTSGGQTTTCSYDSQYPVFRGMGSTIATPTSHTTRSGASYSSNTNSSTPPPPLTPQMPMAGPDMGAIQAQLAQALSAIQTLTQQNQELGMRLRDMQMQRTQESRQEEQGQATGDQMERSPPKRQREPIEARHLESTGTADKAPAGNLGVRMISRDQQVQGEEGYETVHFTNN
jgi:hypothetical protein